MKKLKFFTALFTVGVLLFSTLFTSIGAVRASSSEERAFIPDELIVEFKEGKSNFDSHNLLIEDSFTELGLALVKVTEAERENTIESLKKDKNVKLVEYNYIYRPLSLSKDAFSNWQWGLHSTGQTIEGSIVKEDVDINLPEAWQLIENKDEKLAEVIVAVLDDGVQTNHPDLVNSIWVNTKETPGNGVDEDNNGYKDDVNGWDFYHNDSSVVDDLADGYHGTHVSGTIAAAANNNQGIAGIASNVKIMPIKFIHGNQGGNAWDAIAGIRYAEKNGAEIVLAGWGSTNNSKALEKAIKASKMLFVAAAGNDGKDNDGTIKNYPSSSDSDNIISVGAVNKNGELAEHSNYGDKSVDLVAPGVSIYSTTPGNKYSFAQGTSMAAAHVTGVAALLAGVQETFSSKEIIQILRLTGKETDGAKETISGKMLDAYGALAYYLVSLPLEVDQIYDSSRYISGSTETEATVYVKDKFGGTIIEYKVDKEDGTFEILLNNRFSDGTELVIYSKKGLINSKEIPITVAHDVEKPVLIEGSLDVNDKSNIIEGKVSEYANVEITIAGQTHSVKTNDDGSFSFPIGPFPKYTKGEYTLTDLATPANVTKGKFEIQDSEVPRLEVVPSVNDMTTVVEGQVSKVATVQLKVGNKFLHSKPVQTDESGKFVINISKQKMGTDITIIMVDNQGLVNQETIEVTDGTGPVISKLSKVYETSRYIEGTVNEASTIRIQSMDGELLGSLTEKELSEAANGLFTFNFKLTSKLAKHAKVKIIATDLLGNVSSKETVLTVQEDRTAPKLLEPKKIYIDDVGENEAGITTITGKLSEEGTVDVLVGPESILANKVETNEDGTFTVAIPRQKAKDKLTFVFEDTKIDKPNTSKKTVTVTDKTAPKFIGNIDVYDSSRVITGVIDEPGKVVAWVKQKDKLVKLTSPTAKWNEAKDGYVFTITMKEPQKADTEIPLEAVDSSKNTSENKVVVTVQKDDILPKLDGELHIYDNQTSVRGKVTKEATVELFEEGKSISKSVKTDAAGNFRITIKKQDEGTKITVRMRDISGKPNDAEITVKDGTLPVVSKVETVYHTSKSITGKVSEQSTVTVSRNDTVISSADTDATGAFSISVPELAIGEKLIIVAKDQANNTSKKKSITVRRDTAAPKVTLTEAISVGATEVTGKLNEAGKVLISSKGFPASELIPTAAGDAFTIPLTGWNLEKGQTITITAIDVVGNKKDYKFKVTVK